MPKLIDTSTWTKKEIEQGFAIRRGNNNKIFRLVLDKDEQDFINWRKSNDPKNYWSNEQARQIYENTKPVNYNFEAKTGTEMVVETKNLNDFKSQRMNDINANNIDEFRKLRKEYAQKNIEYKQLNIGVFKKIKALDKGEAVGSLTYYEENGKPIVHYIEVQEDYRRVGIATNMYNQLQKNYPNKEIKFGNLTPDGKKLLDKIGTTRKKKENNENVYYGHIIK